MRTSRMLLVLLTVGVVVAAIVSVGPAGGAAGRTKSVTVEFPFPAPNSSQIDVATVKAKAPEGEKLGRMKLKTTNEGELGTTNPSAVYVTQVPRDRSRTGTFRVYALIKRFDRKRVPLEAQTEPTLDVELTFEDATKVTVSVKPTVGCQFLDLINDIFEESTIKRMQHVVYKLLPAYPPADAHATAAEEILDDVVFDVWGGCAGEPETPDSGTD